MNVKDVTILGGLLDNLEQVDADVADRLNVLCVVPVSPAANLKREFVLVQLNPSHAVGPLNHQEGWRSCRHEYCVSIHDFCH